MWTFYVESWARLVFPGIEKVLHAGLRFLPILGNLLYALFIFKQVRHTCCLSLHVYVHCIACNCMFCMFLVGYLQTPEPVIPLVVWHKLTYLVLTCRKTPINQSINQSIPGGHLHRVCAGAQVYVCV